jgi:hypothetical protein
MTKVDEDIVGGSINSSLSNGAVVVRLFLVSEIEGNKHSIHNNALNASNVPQNGDPHPSIPVIRVDSRVTSAKGSNEILVTVNYKTLDSGNSPTDEEAETQISLGATVQTVETNKHILANGKSELMELKFTYPEGEAPDGVDNEKVVIPTVSKEVPSIIASMGRQESTHPLNKASIFVGTLNKKTFLGTKQKTWLCTKIVGVSNNSGESYAVSYEFQYQSDTWDVELAFTDPETGLIPPTVADNPEALKKFQLQTLEDFDLLKLKF